MDAPDFVEDFQVAIARICAEGEDAVEHYDHVYDQEPAAFSNEDFDPDDDSNFNDQDEPEAPGRLHGRTS